MQPIYDHHSLWAEAPSSGPPQPDVWPKPSKGSFPHIAVNDLILVLILVSTSFLLLLVRHLLLVAMHLFLVASKIILKWFQSMFSMGPPSCQRKQGGSLLCYVYGCSELHNEKLWSIPCDSVCSAHTVHMLQALRSGCLRGAGQTLSRSPLVKALFN